MEYGSSKSKDFTQRINGDQESSVTLRRKWPLGKIMFYHAHMATVAQGWFQESHLSFCSLSDAR